MDIEKTPYETDPVRDLGEALYAFVGAYDRLQLVLREFEDEFTWFADVLRHGIYRPVQPDGAEGSRPSLSLYEIGVVYFPDSYNPGKYSINTRKLEKALQLRGEDVRALFVQSDGILPVLCEILLVFLEEEMPEHLYAAAMRFLNECRRLEAMWL